jgi:uncharacterized protein DUF3108
MLAPARGIIRGIIRGLAVSLAACLALCSADVAAQADARLNAHFKISMTGVSIGQLAWVVDLNAGSYTTSANGKASGALSMLVNGEGRVATRGTFDGDRLRPTFFSSNVVEDGEAAGLQMTFESGGVKTLRLDAPPKNDERIPVTEADRRGVTDPLTAMLLAAPPGDQNALLPAHCDRTLPIFDGQRRYDLLLSFKRVDILKVDAGYAGPVLVCAVALKPIAGYRADSMLVKYVGGRRDMEIWFAPITGTGVIAPARLVMPTLIGTLELAADRFEMVMLKSSTPAISPGTALPPATAPADQAK